MLEHAFGRLCNVTASAPLLRSVPPDAEWFGERITELLAGLTTAFASTGELAGLSPQSVEIVVAEDVAAAVKSLATEVIGVESLQDFSLERVGGTVTGKTMFRDVAHEFPVVVLDAAVFRDESAICRVGEIQITAHELAHAFIGQLRAAGGEPMDPTSLPWEVSRWIARYVIEEYIADSIAESVLGRCGTVTQADGTTRPLACVDFAECAPYFVSAAQETLDNIAETIHDYRLGLIDLETMWLAVQPRTSQMLIALAHAQAEHDHVSGHPGPYATDGAAAPLDRAWRDVCACFSVPLFEGAERFVQAEQAALDRAGKAVLGLWRELGLTFRPEGAAFYISVAPPTH